MAPSNLLWIDDDGPERFRYEEAVLRGEWTIDWAPTVENAIDKLTSTEYAAVLIDQTLPLREKLGPKDIWGGCVVLWWLVYGALPGDLPDAEPYAHLISRSPLAGNRKAPVCVVSAFDNHEVWRTMQQSSVDLPLRPKPIKLEHLRDFLDGTNGRRSP